MAHVPEVVGMQTAGGTAAGYRAGGVAVLECAAQPPADRAGGAPGADDLTVTFEPHFTGGITAQVLAFGVGEQRTQMQRGGALGDVEVGHHGGVLPVRAAGGLGIPAGLDQAQKRLEVTRQRRRALGCGLALGAILLPFGDQRLPMRRQRRLERRRLQMRKLDPPTGELLIAGLGDRGLRWRPQDRVRVAVPA